MCASRLFPTAGMQSFATLPPGRVVQPTEDAAMPRTTVSALEARLRMVEDRLEIYNLIASHPPSADTGADYYTRAIYLEDGAMDLGGGKGASGNVAVAAIVRTAEPVEVPGHGTSRGYRAHRVGANRWELKRTAQGWKIKRRTLRPLDGSEPARELLRTALKPFAPAR